MYNIDSAVQKLGMIFFFKVEDTKGRCIYTGFCVVVYFVKSFLKFVLLGNFFNCQLWLIGYEHRPESGVILTLFSTWGTKNSLAELNLEISGGGW